MSGLAMTGPHTHFVFSQLLEALYPAAVGEARWGEALGLLMQLARCSGEGSRTLFLSALRHVDRALGLDERLSAESRRRATLECAASSLPCGLLLLDGLGAVLFASERATQLLQGRSGIGIEGGRLRSLRPLEERALGRALARLAKSPADGGEAISLQLPAQGEQGPVRMLLMRAAGEAAPAGAVLALLFARDQRAAIPGCALLRDVYGFSPREAELAGLLLAGQSLGEAARTRCVSLNTARSQLKGVLRKTGCRNQADLMRTLITGPAGLLQGLAPVVGIARAR